MWQFIIFVLTVAELKEKLFQDMDKGDQGKHLIRLIQVMETNKITDFREIACWILQSFEKRLPEQFTPEALRCLHKFIIEGHQEGNSSLLVIIFKKLV